VLGLVPESENKASLIAYLHSVGCDSLPVALAPNSVRDSYKLQSTPSTIIIGNDGIVQEAWAGKWTPDTVNAAGSIFGLSFEMAGEDKSRR
jgi:hypothetical protein